LDLDLLYGDEAAGVCGEVAEIDICVGSLAEFLAWVQLVEVRWGEVGKEEGCEPFTYLCFSSSFICSARSRPVPPFAEIPETDSGVPPLEAGTWSLDLVVGGSLSEPGRMMRGEFAMTTLERMAVCGLFYNIS
jgi:hypothetical protein